MSARDDLAGLIFKGWTAQDPPPELHHRYTDTADEVIAAGYRPPARTVSTVEERDALPAGVVVHSADGTIACRHHSGVGVVFGDERPFRWDVLGLPLTVLFGGEPRA